MRPTLPAILAFLVVSSLAAQEPDRRGPATGRVLVELDAQEAKLRLLAASLKRDAFIVTRLVAATGALKDFQPNAALQEALEHVSQASQRAQQRPQASPAVLLALSKATDALIAARKQGSLADFAAVERVLLKQTHRVEGEIFRQFDAVRRERELLGEILTRVTRMTSELDGAAGEALGATFDYFKAGGE